MINQNTEANPNLDSLCLAILDCLEEGDRERLEKIFSYLNEEEKQLALLCTNVWKTNGNTTDFDELIQLGATSESIFVCLMIAEKALDTKDIGIHTEYIYKISKIIDKKNIDQRLVFWYELIKCKAYINLNKIDKAIGALKTLSHSCNDKLMLGTIYYLDGRAHKLKGKKYYAEAENLLNKAVFIAEVQDPNKFLLNLAKLELSFFTKKISSSELLQIANEFSQLGKVEESELAYVQYEQSKAKSASTIDIKDYESVGDYYFISDIMVELLRRIKQFTLGRTGHALIVGPEGAGKEGIAQTIHKLSVRANQPFRLVNCANFNKDLFEAEFFGYEKGAFTGATSQKKGLLEEINGGTIFLDEIGELRSEIQAKFLTLLDTNTFMRVGGTTPITVDIQFIGATNRNLTKMIERDNANRENDIAESTVVFRSDLANRFRGRMRLPSLDERRNEIIPLAEIFLKKLAIDNEKFILDEKAKKHLIGRTYPSNIRSLRNFLETAIGIARESNSLVITAKTLMDSELINNLDSDNADNKIDNELGFDEQILQYGQNLLIKAQKENHYVNRVIAEKLKMPLRSLYRCFEKHGVKYRQ